MTTHALESALKGGAEMLRLGRFAEAKQLAVAMLEQHPDNPAVWQFAGEAAYANEEWSTAALHVDRLLALHPDRPGLLIRKAQILVALRQRAEACATAGQAGEATAINAAGLRAIAKIYNLCNDPESAHRWLVRADTRFPGDPAVLYDLALAQFFLGRIDAAETNLTTLLGRLPAHGGALHLRSLLRTQSSDSNHVAELERISAAGSGGGDNVVYCLFALAKEYEDLEQYEKSFAALEQGARLKRQKLNYSSDNELSAIRGIRTAFTREAARAATRGDDEAGAIFIVGLPRTGTTLTERLLAGHSQVASIGEFTDFPIEMTEQANAVVRKFPEENLSLVQASLRIDFAATGKGYMASARQLARGKPVFVDKLPHNFLYCGYIRKALPNCRIIHITREPVDSCYAIYKTLFNQVYSFSYQLEEIADYYIAYRELMDHWHGIMPGEILDLAYEDVVGNVEESARKVLDWCGLAWEPAVLDFHLSPNASNTASAAQIRQPVYSSSIGKWKNVESHLGALKERLEKAGISIA